MIVSKTPLRISFVGGGTDLSAYYEHEQGAVVSATIDKYVYIFVNRRPDMRYRVSYSRTENVDEACQIQHELVRASLGLLGLTGGGIEIVSVADLPSGMGLGSSSAYTVGLLNALHAFRGEQASPYQLAEEACHVEIEMCLKPIGKQDQYAAAFGGFNYFGFHPDKHDVTVRPLRVWRARQRQIQRHLLLLHTGLKRSAADILREQARNTPGRVEILRRMAALADVLKHELEKGNPLALGELLHLNWIAKSQLASGITNAQIDRWYGIARSYGAAGGKITGAGGGGFLLLHALPDYHAAILRALQLAGLPLQGDVLFDFCLHGSQIVYNDGG